MNDNINFMEKINWSELEPFLHPTGANSIEINHSDLSNLICTGELILTTKSGIPLYLIDELKSLPNGIAIIDSDCYNTNENSKEVILPCFT